MRNRKSYILGVPNFANYESAAALIEVPADGGPVRYVCISEDRLTRQKHTYTFPLRGIDYCLRAMGLESLDEVDLIATDYARLPRWINSGPSYRKLEHDYLKLKLDYDPARIVILDHHDAHAASAFYPSGYTDAAVLVVDGMGSALNTQTLYRARGRELVPLERGHGWGIGKLYAMVTGHVLPYGPEKGFGKVMGLAAYGGEHPGPVLNFAPRDDGMTTDYSAFFSRQPVSRLVGPDIPRCEDRSRVMEPEFARAAFDVQDECERQLLRMAEYAYAKTGATDLCLSGGVALNGRANHLIVERTPIKRVWVPPCCSDTGMPFGLALLAAARHLPEPARSFQVKMPHAYTGRSIDDDEITRTLAHYGVAWRETTADEIAGLIAANKVLGWFEGASETGPRALGHRSILADPRSAAMKDHLNATVKFREGYRPYAPSVLAEHAREWFDLRVDSPFMLMVCEVLPDKRALVPAITHVDNTARIQEVERAQSPNYWALIEAFRQLTGVPMLLNTSLNVNREPIVETVRDTLICAFKTAIDYMVFQGHYLVDCADYRDPRLTQRLASDRDAEDEAWYRGLCAAYLKGYNAAERDAYIARENITAEWYLENAPLYELEKRVLNWRENGARVLIWGTPGHTQVLFEYVPDFARLNVVGCVAGWTGPGERGIWPGDWPVLERSAVDWNAVDLVLVSSHEYQTECVSTLGLVSKPVHALYDTAMDSLYYTLPKNAIPVAEVAGAKRARADVVVTIDEIGAPEATADHRRERYGFVSNYHFVRPETASDFKGQIGITPAAFEAQVRRLVENFAFVTGSELIDPDATLDESVALITFDDSLRDVAEHAMPILARYAVRATLFVPTEPYAEGRVTQTHKRQLIQGRLGGERFRAAFYERLNGRRFERCALDKEARNKLYRFDDETTRAFKIDLNYSLPIALVDELLDGLFQELFDDEREVAALLYLSRDDLLRLHDLGWEIGGHGHRHLPYARLDKDAQAQDIATCRQVLAGMLGEPPAIFSYPFGNLLSYDQTTVAALRRHGFRGAFSTRPGIVRPEDLADGFAIPRFDNQDLFDRDNVLRKQLIEVLSTGD